MTYQVLARKWRPQVFSDCVGQKNIIRSLENSIKEHYIGQAYLFSGTRGVGKTTIARIFAKSIRCQNPVEGVRACDQCACCEDFNKGQSLDVIEIDGASNNGVENIRQLVENVAYLPNIGKYKVYIVDEVHMLSTSAFNALLKTLEEPPAHVVFLFATTEPEKLLDTVLSRVQRFDLRDITVEHMVERIKTIAAEENIHFENDQIVLKLARLGKGSMRDALSLLDQVLNFAFDRKVTSAVVEQALGLVEDAELEKLLGQIIQGDQAGLKQTLEKVMKAQVDLKNLGHGLLERLHHLVLNPQKLPQGFSQQEILWVFETISKDLGWVYQSFSPTLTLEVTLLKACMRRSFLKGFDQVQTAAQQPAKPEEAAVEAAAPVEEPAEETEAVQEEEVKAEAAPTPEVEPGPEAPKERTYSAFLDFLAKKSPASAANLDQGNLIGELEFPDNGIQIRIGFKESEKVFLDYLQDRDIRQKLMSNVADYFALPIEKVSLSLELIQSEKAAEQNFMSRAEVADQNREQKRQAKEKELLNDPIIQEAQRLFNTNVDKVRVEI